MKLYGIRVEYTMDCFSGLNHSVLEKLWREPPTEEEIKIHLEKALKKYNANPNRLGDAEVQNWRILDFYLED